MGFGNPFTDDLGITFTIRQNPGHGQFKWIQFLRDEYYAYTPSRRCSIVTFSPGLDTSFPYPFDPGSTTETSDLPSIGLLPSDTQATRTFSAQMFLMWQASRDDTMVPLGSVTWGFSEISHVDKSGWTTPSVRFTPPSVSFQPNTMEYPVWDNLANPRCAN